MKLLQWMKDGKPALGVRTDAGVVDVSGADPQAPATMLELCRQGQRGLARLEALVKAAPSSACLPEERLTLAPAVTGMEKILCVGLNYRAHALESGMAIPENPTIFSKFPNALAAQGQEIALPPTACQVDYEAELVMVMGPDHTVFGYTCGNDLSIREWQKASTQWLCGKSADGFGPIGPVVVDAASVNADRLHICSRVNGELRQNSNTSDLIFDCKTLVDYIDARIPLKPGDIIFTGTPAGVAMGMPEGHQRWLRDGDCVEVEIEGIGTLRNVLRR